MLQCSFREGNIEVVITIKHMDFYRHDEVGDFDLLESFKDSIPEKVCLD